MNMPFRERGTFFGGVLLSLFLVLFGRPVFAEVEPLWDFFIDGNKLLDSRLGEHRLFRGISFSGLEYGQATHGNIPEVYPGEEGVQYFSPTAEDFDQIQGLGVNCVRLPFDFGRLVQGLTNYHSGDTIAFDSTYLEYLEEAIELARQRHLFVIPDMHNSLEYAVNKEHIIYINNNTNYQSLLIHTWQKIAEHFYNRPNILGYEIINEPNPNSGDSHWFEIAQRMIDAIRRTDRERILFIDGRDYSGAQQWVHQSDSLRHLTDPSERIVYAPHLYLDIQQNGTYDPGDHAPPANWEYEVYEDVKNILSWSKEVNRPILITEFGFLSDYSSWEPVLSELLSEYLDFHSIGSLLWNMETSRDGEDQETYIFGGTGYIAEEYLHHADVSYNGNRSSYIFYNNLHNGFDVDMWSGADPHTDWNQPFRPGIGYDESIGFGITGSWTGANLLFRNMNNVQTCFDLASYETFSFLFKGGVGLRVWAADCEGTESQKYDVAQRSNYELVEIPISDLIASNSNTRYIKFQVGGGGSVYLDEIQLIRKATIQITQPGGVSNTASTSYNIRWIDEDPDYDATISLYYDTDPYGQDGVPIEGAQHISAREITNSFVWDITPIPDGEYFVYGVITAGEQNAWDYSDVPVIVRSAQGLVQWWVDYNVLNPEIETHDYTTVNSGQLKHMASKAREAMDDLLPGGAGTNIHTLVDDFQSTNNYAAINLGQLKYVAQPFYDRLWELGMTNAYPAGVTTKYPWDSSTNSPTDYALVNVGQIKYIFSFKVE